MSTKTRVHDDQQALLHAPPQPITRVEEVRSGFSHREPCQAEAAAAVAVRPISGATRKRVMEAIALAALNGRTRHEIAQRTGLSLQSVCGRVKELIDGGFVEQTPRMRDGRHVLVSTLRGYRAVG